MTETLLGGVGGWVGRVLILAAYNQCRQSQPQATLIPKPWAPSVIAHSLCTSLLSCLYSNAISSGKAPLIIPFSAPFKALFGSHLLVYGALLHYGVVSTSHG